MKKRPKEPAAAAPRIRKTRAQLLEEIENYEQALSEERHSVDLLARNCNQITKEFEELVNEHDWLKKMRRNDLESYRQTAMRVASACATLVAVECPTLVTKHQWHNQLFNLRMLEFNPAELAPDEEAAPADRHQRNLIFLYGQMMTLLESSLARASNSKRR